MQKAKYSSEQPVVDRIKQANKFSSEVWTWILDGQSIPCKDNQTHFQTSQMDPSRISLRRFQLSDVDDFLKWASDDKVTRYLRWNTITSWEEALAYLEKIAIPQPYRRSICLDGNSIGYVSIKPGSGDDECRAHLGYAVSAEFWGQGIATAALKMAVSDVFKEFPGLVRIEALVEVQNLGSQKVLDKVGFLKEGLLRKYGFCKGDIRDMFIYSILSTDFLN